MKKKQVANQEIAAVLRTVTEFTGQGAVYHALEGRHPIENESVCAFCHFCLNHPASASFCRHACCDATMHSLSSGEPYFYRCWAGLLFVTVAIAPQDTCCGGISLGGFYSPGEAGDIRDTLVARLSPVPRADQKAFVSHLKSLRRITPRALRGLGHFVMEAAFSSGVNSNAFFRTQNEKYLQQREIAEAFADIRREDISSRDIVGDAYELVSYLYRQDKKSARQFTSRYLAELLMASNWDLQKLKAHVRVLLAILTSEEILRGTPWAAATSREMRHMARLEKAQTTEESCYEVAELLQRYMERGEAPELEGRSVTERGLHWLHTHYSERAILAVAAKAVATSESSLAKHLRRDTGRTFKQLLADVRIAEAKKLLATTALEISEIADRCGFFDQSHLTKTFRALVNLTPGEFRKLLKLPDAETVM